MQGERTTGQGQLSEGVTARIAAKKLDYHNYDFTSTEDLAFKIFFDLAQEFPGMQEFYDLCVGIIRELFGMDSRLFIIDLDSRELKLAACAAGISFGGPAPAIPAVAHEHTEGGSLVLRVRGNRLIKESLPFKTDDGLLGILEIIPKNGLTHHHEFFFEKFSNRIGYSLHNRYIAIKNVKHLQFIRQLVDDIEHNVIGPNMVYKLYFRNLQKALERCAAIEDRLAEAVYAKAPISEEALREVGDVNLSLRVEFDNITRHHRNMSLFLESLLRRGHFEQGRLILQKKHCNLVTDILQPQMERFLDRMSAQHIIVECGFSADDGRGTEVMADVGLMAQVYSNLLSNAIKYTEPVESPEGRLKRVRCGYEFMAQAFPEGREGVKYYVESTGPEVPADEREPIFRDRFRGSNKGDKPGSGHGLSFVKNVVEAHGGRVGYEPVELGNRFYFILPRADSDAVEG